MISLASIAYFQKQRVKHAGTADIPWNEKKNLETKLYFRVFDTYRKPCMNAMIWTWIHVQCFLDGGWLRMCSLTTASFVTLEPCPNRVKCFSTPCQVNKLEAICPLMICFPKMKLLMTGDEGEGSSEKD